MLLVTVGKATETLTTQAPQPTPLPPLLFSPSPRSDPCAVKEVLLCGAVGFGAVGGSKSV